MIVLKFAKILIECLLVIVLIVGIMQIIPIKDLLIMIKLMMGIGTWMMVNAMMIIAIVIEAILIVTITITTAIMVIISPTIITLMILIGNITVIKALKIIIGMGTWMGLITTMIIRI